MQLKDRKQLVQCLEDLILYHCCSAFEEHFSNNSIATPELAVSDLNAVDILNLKGVRSNKYGLEINSPYAPLEDFSPAILNPDLKFDEVELYQHSLPNLDRDYKQLLNPQQETFPFLLNYQLPKTTQAHFVACLLIRRANGKNICFVVDSLCGETWKSSLLSLFDLNNGQSLS